MDHQAAAPSASGAKKPRRRWQFSWLNLAISILLLAGLVLLVYPTAASWVSQYNQSNLITDQAAENSRKAQAEISKSLKDAHQYNDLLESGALLASGAHVAEGTGTTETQLDYWKLLKADPTGVMARLQVPAIDLDLPVYHGTSEKTLLAGVGHLQGTSLPVGGDGTRSVLTGHRGLANATMFTNLDRVKKGDTFSVEVLGEVFTYRVFKIEVVDPDATEEIRAVKGKDLMTLVTCTPLGINTHRILITGERVSPTPASDIESMTAAPDVPGFPWWIVILSSGTLVIGTWYWRAGLGPRSKRTRDEKKMPMNDER